jgi:hypothetical protein
MDKGREALIKINRLAKQWARGIDYMEKILRSHGWLHEDDVVEGRHWCLHYRKTCMYTLCSRSHDWTSCDKVRPATVKDLIKGGE